MLDPRGQLLRAAVGFAGCSMPSYNPALRPRAPLGLGTRRVPGLDQRTTARTLRLRPSLLNRSAAGGSRGREFSFSNNSERERARSSSRDEPTGRSCRSPWARWRLRYGSETVTLSPDAEMLKVPDPVLAAYV